MALHPQKAVASSSFACTLQGRNSKAQVTIASANYPAASLTETRPTTTGQSVVIYTETAACPSLLKIVPFHFANNATGQGVRVIGWNSYGQSSGLTLWTATLLADLTPDYNTTVGSIPSCANFDGTASTAYFYSAITAAGGTPTVSLYSPGVASAANTAPAHAVIDTMGSEIVMLQFKSSGSSNMGCLWYTI
jgi:hypothetical protein